MGRKRSRVVDEHPSSEDKTDEQQQQQKEEQQTPSKKQLKFDAEPEKVQEDEAVDESNTDVEESAEKEKAVIVSKPQDEAEAETAVVIVEEDGLEKKGFVNRLWSLNDEILVLQGVIDFKEEFDKDPVIATNSDDFFDFIKGKLEYTIFTKDQVIGKLRKLKKKYTNKLKKSSAGNGKDPHIPNPHELKCFQLSKKIWGDRRHVVVEDDDENEEKKGLVELEKHVSMKDFRRLYPHLIKAFEDEEEDFPKVMPLYGLMPCLSNVDSGVLEEWNEEWKKIRLAEVDVYLRRLAIIQEQTKWFYNQIKSS